MLPGIGKVYGLASSFLRLLDDQTQIMFQSFWHGLYRLDRVLRHRSESIRSAYGMDMRIQSREIVSMLISPVVAKPLPLNPLSQSHEFGIDRIASRPIIFVNGDRSKPENIYVRQTAVLGVDQVLWSYVFGAQNIPSSSPRSFAAYRTDSSLPPAVSASVPGEVEWAEVVSNTQVQFKGWYLIMSDGDKKSWFEIDAVVILDGLSHSSVELPAEDEYQILVEPRFFDEYLQASNDVRFWITTGSDFQLDADVIAVSDFTPFTVEDSGEDGSQAVAVKGKDFRFDRDTSTVEFFTSPWEVFGQELGAEFTVFCEQGEVSDSAKYAQFSAAGFDNRFQYNTTNPEIDVLGKSAWYGLQFHGDLVAYRGLTSTYYGLPTAPYDGIVVGQFESYGYEVALDQTDPQGGTRWRLQTSTASSDISHLSGKVLCNSVVYDLTNGTFTSEDDVAGHTAYLYIQGRYDIRQLRPPNQFVIQTPKDAGSNRMLPQISNCQVMSGEYPPLIIVSKTMPELNGWYHLTNTSSPIDSAQRSVAFAASESDPGILMQIYQFDEEVEREPLYHDHVIPEALNAPDTDTNSLGVAIVPFPTHKFLLIANPATGRVDRIWMDAPVFSSLNAGDHITQGQILFETVVAVPASDIRQAPALDIRRSSGGKLRHSNYIFELVVVDPNAEYGRYAPVEVQELD